MYNKSKDFHDLLYKSIFLSESEKNAFTKNASKIPDYLIDAAQNAVKEESDFFQRLKIRFPEIYSHIHYVNNWIKDDNKRLDSFPGFGFQFRDDILNDLYTDEKVDIYQEVTDESENEENNEKESEQEKSHEQPLVFKSFGVEELSDISNYIDFKPDISVDKKEFIKLLSESLSLNIQEKMRVIESSPRLSQYQVDALIKVFEEEREKFARLALENQDDVIKLQKRCLSEWKMICSTFQVKYIIKTFIQTESAVQVLETILSIENAFQHLHFNKALKLINNALANAPHNIFLYEYFFQAIKIEDPLLLQPEIISTLPNNDRFSKEFSEVLLLFIEFENIWKNGKKFFLNKISQFDSTVDYAFIKPYLLSKFFLYYGDPDEERFSKSFDHLLESISLGNDSIEHISCLYHFNIKILIAQQNFSSLYNLLSYEPLPVYYQYLKYLAELHLYIANNKRNHERLKRTCKEALKQFISDYAKDNQLEDIVLHFDEPNETKDLPSWLNLLSKTNTNTLYQTIKSIEKCLNELNFVNTEDYQFETQMQTLIVKKDFDKATACIAEKLKKSEWGLHEYSLSTLLTSIYRKTNIIDKKYNDDYKKNFHSKMNFHHALLLYKSQHAMESKYRYEARSTAQWLTQRYYYLPQGHLYQFENSHKMFVNSEIPLDISQHLFLAMANGYDKSLFDFFSEYYQWIGWHINADNIQFEFQCYAQMYDLINNITSNGNFYSNIIGQRAKDWQDISVAFFLMSINKIKDDPGSYNCLSIFVKESKHIPILIRTLLLVRAQDVNINWDSPALLSNKPSSQYKKILPHCNNYFSLFSIFIDPDHTWNNYSSFLDIAEDTKSKQLYLTAYYTALELECSQLNVIHKQKALTFVSEWLDDQLLPDDFSLCIYLAQVLIAEKGKWIEEKNIPDTEGITYDLLRHAEKLLEKKNNSVESFFLGKYAHANYLMQTSSEWYLLYRYPKTTYADRFKIQIEQLKMIKEEYPLSQKKINLDEMIRSYTSKEFISSIDSGRVVWDIKSTQVKVWPELIDKINNFNSAFLKLQEEISSAEVNIDTIKNSIISNYFEKLKQSGLFNKAHIASGMFIGIQILFKTVIDHSNVEHNLNQFNKKYQPDKNQQSYIHDLVKDLLQTINHRFGSKLSEYQKLIDTSLQQIEEIRLLTCIDLFHAIKKHHVMQGSDMFDSFRKRIRHGWLIANLKYCFTQYELIMEADSTEVAPAIQKILEQVEQVSIKESIINHLDQLKQKFYQIATCLENDILVIKDDAHPEGLLDYSDTLLKPEELCKNFLIDGGLTERRMVDFIELVCNRLEVQTLHCFDAIKEYLQISVYDELEKEIQLILKTITQEKNFIPDYKLLTGLLDDALSDFKKGIERYKKWFAFYESSFRNFLLTEVIDASQKLVWDTHSADIQRKNVQKATLTGFEPLKNIYLAGKNFFELLDLFKILFQNVVFHSCTFNVNDPVLIHIQAEQNFNENQSFTIHFYSTNINSIDVTSLKNQIKNESQRNKILCQQSGTGLPTVEDILLKRLVGITGSIKEIESQEKENLFCVSFSFHIKEKADKYLPGLEEHEKKKPVENLIEVNKQSNGINVLIVEDQRQKCTAIQSFLSNLIIQSNYIHAWDVETSLQLIFSSETKFDLIILDMTLPLESSFAAELKSLAGLSILKILNDHEITIPCILMTQYTNWFSETQLNKKIFISQLDQYCKSNYPTFYKGAIRFSHTEIEWQNTLKDIVIQVVDKKYLRHLQIQTTLTVQELEAQLKERPNDIELLKELALAYRHKHNFRKALNPLLEIKELQPDDISTDFDIAEMYAEIGDHESAMNYCKQVKSKSNEQGNILQEKILTIRKQWLNSKQKELMINSMHMNLGELAKLLSHEFSSPLASFELTLYNLFDDYDRGILNKELVDEYNEDLSEDIKHMKSLLKNMKQLASDNTFNKSLVDLNDVIHNSFRFFHKLFKRDNIDVQLNLYNIPKIRANETSMTQIFINLIMNAKDSLKKVDYRKREIIVETRRIVDPFSIVITFSDTGIGIPDENKDKLFNLYFSSKLEEKGMGYGLWMIKNVISDLGGTIKLEDHKSDKLTTFHIELPLSAEEEVS